MPLSTTYYVLQPCEIFPTDDTVRDFHRSTIEPLRIHLRRHFRSMYKMYHASANPQLHEGSEPDDDVLMISSYNSTTIPVTRETPSTDTPVPPRAEEAATDIVPSNEFVITVGSQWYVRQHVERPQNFTSNYHKLFLLLQDFI